MANYNRKSVTISHEVWTLDTPVAYAEISKVLATVQKYLHDTDHPFKDFDDACMVTVGDDQIVFTVVDPS